jgi:hypothetical protein
MGINKNNDNKNLVLYNRSGHARVASYTKPSSAFCANAKPDENWTLISDTGERRKIQNRISQRNYRELIHEKTWPTTLLTLFARSKQENGTAAGRTI